MEGAPTSAPADTTASTTMGGETEANVQFLDATPIKSVSGPILARYKGPVFSMPTQATEYLTRPVQIYRNIASGAVAWTINPLALYFAVTAVAAKARNVARLRATINLRIQITGNPYTYGRLQAVYHPYPGTRGTALTYFNKYSMSQMLGGTLDPSCNDVLQISIPYHGVNDFWNTDEVRAAPAGTYGELWIGDLNVLRVYGTAANASVPISVYMWLSDIEAQLSTPTAFMIPQARDEYGQGPVSKVATAVANTAARLRDVPVIGLYARATEIGASAVAGVASLFGWGSPLVLKSRTYVRHDRFPPMPALVDDTSYKLALDPKQELSVDPSIVAGTNTDDMALAAIWSRPSLIYNFTWSPTQAANTVLMNMPVTPGLVFPIAALKYAFTPLFFASAMFERWTGGLVFTFDVVASRFHTGRVRVSFIPNADAIVDDLTYATSNVIIDLAASRTVRMRVPYNATQPWKNVSLRESNTVAIAGDMVNCSGVLVMDVIDALSSNLSSDIAYINVSVAGDEDFAVQAPTTRLATRWCWTNAACVGFCATGAAGMTRDPCDITDVALFGPANVPREVSSVFFGQAVTSIRAMIKTYNPYIMSKVTNNSTIYSSLLLFAHPTRPLMGNTVTAQATITDTYNYWTFYSWYAQGFLGVRGGTRWKVDFVRPYLPADGTPIAEANTRGAFASLINDMSAYAAAGVASAFLSQPTGGPPLSAMRLAYGIAQCAFQSFGIGELVEIDVPSMHPQRFTTGWGSSAYTFGAPNAIVSGAGCEKTGFAVSAPFYSQTTNPTDIPVVVYQAGAEDASFSWFVCGPVLFSQSQRAT